MADDILPLASLSLTHIYYDPEDYISLVCAYLALLPHALCVVYATLILTTREAEVLLMFAGQLACEILNLGLKQVIKEERPRRTHSKGYGMPSSHAQFIAFWGVSLALFLLVRHKPRSSSTLTPSSSSFPTPSCSSSSSSASSLTTTTTAGDGEDKEDKEERRATNEGWYLTTGVWSFEERVLLSVAGLVVAAATAWSRLYLNYHTEKQVAVGSLAGLVFAGAWFLFTEALRRSGLLAWAMGLPLARALKIRDLAVEEDTCVAGWEKWERKRLAGKKDL